MRSMRSMRSRCIGIASGLCLLLGVFEPTAYAEGGGVSHAQVNTREGTTCPTLFDGGAGLCFPASTVPYVVETLRNRKACDATAVALEECKKVREDLAEAVRLLDLETAQRKLQNELLQKSLEAERSSAGELKSALSDTKWKWFFGTLGALIGGGASGYLLGRVLK